VALLTGVESKFWSKFGTFCPPSPVKMERERRGGGISVNFYKGVLGPPPTVWKQWASLRPFSIYKFWWQKNKWHIKRPCFTWPSKHKSCRVVADSPGSLMLYARCHYDVTASSGTGIDQCQVSRGTEYRRQWWYRPNPTVRRNGTRQPMICVLVVKSKRCSTLSTLVLCQS